MSSSSVGRSVGRSSSSSSSLRYVNTIYNVLGILRYYNVIIIILYLLHCAGEASFKLVTDDWAFLSIFKFFFSTFSHRAGQPIFCVNVIYYIIIVIKYRRDRG